MQPGPYSNFWTEFSKIGHCVISFTCFNNIYSLRIAIPIKIIYHRCILQNYALTYMFSDNGQNFVKHAIVQRL